MRKIPSWCQNALVAGQLPPSVIVSDGVDVVETPRSSGITQPTSPDDKISKAPKSRSRGSGRSGCPPRTEVCACICVPGAYDVASSEVINHLRLPGFQEQPPAAGETRRPRHASLNCTRSTLQTGLLRIHTYNNPELLPNRNERRRLPVILTTKKPDPATTQE